ncbi:MAG TPA: hypothetical protein H9685_03480 [Firmicutes bacterium]|nr:hypothetical protein [Bacillota bacterium]
MICASSAAQPGGENPKPVSTIGIAGERRPWQELNGAAAFHAKNAAR